MKIKKNQLRLRSHGTSDQASKIMQVLEPFEFQLESKHINVYLLKVNNFNMSISADWRCYELLLFNIIQNAFKYNVIEGDILLLLRVKPITADANIMQRSKCSNEEGMDRFMMETEIIDTGIGIPQERQNMLFVPFLELKSHQANSSDSIGLGLACSQAIVQRMEGDITIKQSRKGLTVFTLKFPVYLDAREYKATKTQNNSQ